MENRAAQQGDPLATARTLAEALPFIQRMATTAATTTAPKAISIRVGPWASLMNSSCASPLAARSSSAPRARITMSAFSPWLRRLGIEVGDEPMEDP